MSSIFMQAADYRYMTPNSHFMSHYGSVDINTDYLSAISESDYHRTTADTMFNVYTGRCVEGKFFYEKFGKKPSVKQVRQYLITKLKSGDWYLNAEQAVYYGFADSILRNWHFTE
jgi:ATP-dependent protease ClpP protease subunit